jgi:hypothetical protein
VIISHSILNQIRTLVPPYSWYSGIAFDASQKETSKDISPKFRAVVKPQPPLFIQHARQS